jgi:integrase
VAKKTLTDRLLKSLKRAPEGQRYEVIDAVVPGLGVRVSPTGQRTFILIARFGGSKNPTRRAIGECGVITLEMARAKARSWIELIREGKDPKHEEERLRRAEIRKQKQTFESVAEEYIDRHIKKLRTAKESAREIRNELISEWSDRPISELRREDVVSLIEDIADRPAPYKAHLVFAHMRSLFNWAINRGTYGLETAPTDRLRPTTLIGPKEPRQRVLSDAELAALWRATEKTGYPYGPLYRMLMLTGARKSGVAGARRREIDGDKKLWTVPAERFKSNATHLVPLTDLLLALIAQLPEFKKGDLLFSTSFGVREVSGFSQAKRHIDDLMAAELGKKPEPWVVHDIRRTVRTRLASLRVPDMIAEMVIGNGRRGLQRTYDLHSYETEMREALELWAGRLRDIVTPPPENVLQIKKETA